MHGTEHPSLPWAGPAYRRRPPMVVTSAPPNAAGQRQSEAGVGPGPERRKPDAPGVLAAGLGRLLHRGHRRSHEPRDAGAINSLNTDATPADQVWLLRVRQGTHETSLATAIAPDRGPPRCLHGNAPGSPVGSLLAFSMICRWRRFAGSGQAAPRIPTLWSKGWAPRVVGGSGDAWRAPWDGLCYCLADVAHLGMRRRAWTGHRE